MKNTINNNSEQANPLIKKSLRKSKIHEKEHDELLDRKFLNPIWLSISECAKIGGVKTKTIRRAIQSKILKYKINGSKYFIELSSLIIFLNTTTKLTNKLNQNGIGQYIEKWKK
jgi:hypothetical protein